MPAVSWGTTRRAVHSGLSVFRSGNGLEETKMAYPAEPASDPDLQYRYDTYKNFVRYTFIFAAHVLVILALLAYFAA